MKKIALIPALLSLAFSNALFMTAYAQPSNQIAKPIKLDEGYGEAFLNYAPYITQGKEPEAPKVTPSAPSPAPEKPSAKTVDVEWLRRNYTLLEDRAINDPSDINISAYLYAKRIVMDKAQRFSEAVTKVLNEDPLLNENNRIPYASAGAQSVRNADYLAQQQAAREMAAQGGVVIFIDGSCRFCALQIPVIQAVKNNLGLEFLVVSVDGSIPKGYTGPRVIDNGLYHKLGLKLTPSIVYVPRPKGYQGIVDPNQYLIISQGFYAQDELVKQIAYAGHKTRLLSSQTLRDLDIWDRGVAATEDLRELKLDVNKPASIKQALQPILSKQYK